MKNLKYIVFLLLFGVMFWSVNVQAATTPYGECTKTTQGNHMVMTCKAGFTVNEGVSKKYKFKFRLNFAGDFAIEKITKTLGEGWYLEEADDATKTYTVVGKSSSFSVGNYDMITFTVEGETPSLNCNGSITYVNIDSPPRICEISHGNYYDQSGNLTDEVTYNRRCTVHNCDEVTDTANNITYYYDNNGYEVSKEVQDIYCKEHICEEVQDPSTHEVYYFDSGSSMVEAEEYFTQCKPHICKTYTDVNTSNIYYFDASGSSVSESDYHDSCDAKPTCEMSGGKYYDNNGNEVEEATYKRICLPHNCDTIEDGSNTYYYNKNGMEVDEITYKRQCRLHNCDTLKDEERNITYY